MDDHASVKDREKASRSGQPGKSLQSRPVHDVTKFGESVEVLRKGRVSQRDEVEIRFHSRFGEYGRVFEVEPDVFGRVFTRHDSTSVLTAFALFRAFTVII